MMFASKTPRDLNHDPMPWAHTACGYEWCDDFGGRFPFNNGTGNVFEPRPEFDHVQHNEPNPILVELRKRNGQDRMHYVRGFLAYRPERYRWPNWTADHVSHAHRVLTRLARLAEVAS